MCVDNAALSRVGLLTRTHTHTSPSSSSSSVSPVNTFSSLLHEETLSRSCCSRTHHQRLLRVTSQTPSYITRHGVGQHRMWFTRCECWTVSCYCEIREAFVMSIQLIGLTFYWVVLNLTCSAECHIHLCCSIQIWILWLLVEKIFLVVFSKCFEYGFLSS